ncbi:MAG: cell surface protein [Planctomycetes bacterium]|nr:cell surface protein [Planctomycetota bacterium]
MERNRPGRRDRPFLWILRILWMSACGCSLAAASIASASGGDGLGPSSVAATRDGKTLYVATADARQVAWVDVAGEEVTRRVGVPGEPTGLILTPDESRLIVTCAAPRSTVLVLDPASGETRASITAGHTAMGPAIAPDGRRLYVCNRFSGDVSVIDLDDAEEIRRVQAEREPVAAAVAPDGRVVLVANHLPSTRTDVLATEQIAAVVTIIDTHSLQTRKVRLTAGSHSLRGIAVSPDGKLAFATHVHCNFELTPTQLDLGWASTNVISVIDIEKESLVKTVGLDEVTLGAANPWGVAVTADGKWICVAHAGTNELSAVESSILHENLPQMFISPYIRSLPEESRPGADRRRRIQLPGKGPRALAIAGSKVYVASYFSDTVDMVDVLAEKGAPLATIALGPPPRWSLARRGEYLFNDGSLAYQHWHSCASCHPDGRSDALNWDLMNDGVGNTKNTKSLVLSVETPPTMAEGVRATAEEAVRGGLENILFTIRPAEEMEAIHEYLRSLAPVPSPRLVEGRLTPAAERGKALFESDRVGCHGCHPAPLYTDLKKHDVGTPGSYGVTLKLDTPTLVEVWRTAPYLHDGRYVTIEELIAEGKHGESAGKISELSEQEIDDLVEFVLSL